MRERWEGGGSKEGDGFGWVGWVKARAVKGKAIGSLRRVGALV